MHVGSFERWIHAYVIKLNDNKSEFFVATSPYHKGRMATVPLLVDNKFIMSLDAIGNMRVLFNSHSVQFYIPVPQYFANTSFPLFRHVPACHSSSSICSVYRLDSGKGLPFSCTYD